MAGKNMSVVYSLLVLSSCILQGYSLPQRRMSAEEFGRKFGGSPNEISNEIDYQEEVSPAAKEEGGLSATIIDIALQVVPLIVKALTDGTGPSQTDRIEDVSLNGEDPFSVQNILVLGLKLFLAVAGNNSDVDRNDNADNSPLQAVLKSVMPAVISAATGSKDRQELETMAGQATQVIELVFDLINTLTTSMSQRRSFY